MEASRGLASNEQPSRGRPSGEMPPQLVAADSADTEPDPSGHVAEAEERRIRTEQQRHAASIGRELAFNTQPGLFKFRRLGKTALKN